MPRSLGKMQMPRPTPDLLLLILLFLWGGGGAENSFAAQDTVCECQAIVTVKLAQVRRNARCGKFIKKSE